MSRIILSLLLLFVLNTAALAQETGDKVMLRLYADKTAAVPGQTLRIAIEQVVADGWHTYWTNPGDSGEAMKIKWQLPEGMEPAPVMWPTPERIPYGPLMNFGYHNHAVILTDVKVPTILSDALGSTMTIKGQANVLVCDEICIPETHAIALDIPVAASAGAANTDLFETAAAAIPVVRDWHTVTEVDADEVRVRITLPATANAFASDPESTVWFPYEWGYIENATDQSASYEPSTRTLTLRQGRADTRDVSKLSEGTYILNNGDESVVVSGSITQLSASVMGTPARMPQTDASVPLILLFAFVGGLILNLMPCVFPVLSMKALHLVSLPKGERTHAQLSGILYALGVVSMFVVLGGALYAVRAAGEQLGWGFQLQNPAIVAGLSWLLFIVGLNLAGVFDLRIAFGGEVLLAEKHHPLVTSFLTGVLATLVATPCSAPFMATALGAALVQPMPVALSIFAMVGVGLAVPYCLLCFVPALQKILPRPGAWMVTFRQLLAFPMFASAVWLVWVVAQQGASEAVGWTLGGMVMLAFAIWLLDLQPKLKATRGLLTVVGTALLCITLGSLSMVVPVEKMEEAMVKHNYKAFNTESFDHALNDGKGPIFVNMTASWCITCLVNEKTTLDTQDVREHFKALNVTYFKGDWTNKDPSITSFLQSYGRTGVPLYVYFAAPSPDTGKRPQPVVLPQILTPEIMLQAIQ
ncbi:MAG: thioredoxin family protein [Alphaproteobacteria bacterium]|nr:thioredoxin family protein [Alphaproteobacteria bacterium]